jgi:hypothetical protein
VLVGARSLASLSEFLLDVGGQQGAALDVVDQRGALVAH